MIISRRCWSILVRRPLRLLFLDSMLEGVEVRAADVIREAPGPDRPSRGVEFPGFEIVGSLPSGGSGAKLYIARPDEKTRARLEGRPEEVVIKSFALAEGSSLPQIVRESRSLESGRRLGLVLAHDLGETQFWYAMPYHPGDHLGVVVRDAHQAEFEDGLRGNRLREMLGYAMDLVRTLDRYHGEGLWHKDVKPDNIIVHDGSAHLVDFGLVTSLRSAMTLTTHGTEYFRDPEMVRMAMRGVKVHEVDGAKFDVYGAGAVLYYILENTFPGHGGLSRFERPAPEAARWIVRRAMADYGQR
jgi:serine/threonine protein kinase